MSENIKVQDTDILSFVKVQTIMGFDIDSILNLVRNIHPDLLNRHVSDDELRNLYVDLRQLVYDKTDHEFDPDPKAFFQKAGPGASDLEKAYLDWLETMVKDKEHILLKEVMNETDTPEHVARYLLDKLGYESRNFVWVPRNLETDKKMERKIVCQQFLQKYTWDTLFVRSIVSIDEFWLRSYYPLEESSAYKLKGTSPPRKKRITLSDWKRMVIVACYQGQVISYILVPEHTTVDGLFFLNFLKSKVFPEIKKRSIKKVQLMWDHAGAHRDARIASWLGEVKWEKFEYPSLSPDMFPPDYSIIKKIVEYMPKGNQMTPEVTVQAFVQAVKNLNSNPKWDELELPSRWKKIVESEGRYLEDVDHPWR